jgi:hypothetical protein
MVLLEARGVDRESPPATEVAVDGSSSYRPRTGCLPNRLASRFKGDLLMKKSCWRMLAMASLAGTLMLAAAVPAGASGNPSDEEQPNPIMCMLQGGGDKCFGEGGGGGGGEKQPSATPADEGPKPNPNPIMCVIQGGQNCFGQGGGGGEKGGGDDGGGGGKDGPQYA